MLQKTILVYNKYILIMFTKSLFKWIVSLLIVVISIAVAYWYFFVFFQPNTIETQHIVERKDIEDVLTVYGTVMSDSDRTLSFQTSGVVKSVLKKEGNRILKNEVIAYLNNDDLNADIAKAYIELEIEKSKLEDIKGGPKKTEAVSAQQQFTVISANARREIDQAIIELDDILNDTKQAVFLELDHLFSNARTRRPYFKYNINHQAKEAFENKRKEIQYILDSWDQYVFNTVDIDSVTAEFFISSVNGVLHDIYVIHDYLQKIILDLSEELVTVDDADEQLLNRVYLVTSSARKRVVERRDNVILELSNVSKGLSDFTDVIEEIKSKIKTQELYILSKEIDIDRINADLEKTIIRSPVDGTISELDLTVGQNIASHTYVGRVFTKNDYQIEVDVSELDIDDLDINDEVIINFNAFKGDYDGIISDISLQEKIKNNISVYVVTIDFDTDKVDIKTGFGVDVRISKKFYDNALYVPQSSVVKDKKGARYVFEKDFMTGKLTKRQIRVVDVVGSDVIIRSGVYTGDIVVTNPNKYKGIK